MKRRSFIKSSAFAGIGVMTSRLSFAQSKKETVQNGLRVGIIGLDTSHATAVTRLLNADDPSPDFGGYRVVAAYPHGTREIEERIRSLPGYIEEVKKYGVEIIESIPELLTKVDVTMLLSNDGRVHMEQAIPVFKAGKPAFINKSVGGTLTDTFAIYQAAKDYNIPVFSSSSVRYMTNIEDIVKNQSIGKVLGAETYSPCYIEPGLPDFFYYGIHGIEALFAIMGTGCKTTTRIHTPDTDVVVGVWDDNRIGTFRGLRAETVGYGGHVFGEKGIQSPGEMGAMPALLKNMVKFFRTGIAPVTPEETLEIYTFMEAADESKRRGGAAVSLAETRQKALSQLQKTR